MNAAHTSGSWVWVEGTDLITREWNNKSWPIASVGNCRLGWHEDQNCEGREAGANARLIAAAPDLLAALKNFVDGCSVNVNAVEVARAAIAKAVQS